MVRKILNWVILILLSPFIFLILSLCLLMPKRMRSWFIHLFNALFRPLCKLFLVPGLFKPNQKTIILAVDKDPLKVTELFFIFGGNENNPLEAIKNIEGIDLNWMYRSYDCEHKLMMQSNRKIVALPLLCEPSEARYIKKITDLCQQHIQKHPHIKQLGFFGHSLGGAIACAIAEKFASLSLPIGLFISRSFDRMWNVVPYRHNRVTSFLLSYFFSSLIKFNTTERLHRLSTKPNVVVKIHQVSPDLTIPAKAQLGSIIKQESWCPAYWVLEFDLFLADRQRELCHIDPHTAGQRTIQTLIKKNYVVRETIRDLQAQAL